jgi:hypothetical protein
MKLRSSNRTVNSTSNSSLYNAVEGTGKNILKERSPRPKIILNIMDTRLPIPTPAPSF